MRSSPKNQHHVRHTKRFYILISQAAAAEKKKHKKQTQPNLTGDGEKNEMLCVYIIQYKTVCQE